MKRNYFLAMLILSLSLYAANNFISWKAAGKTKRNSSVRKASVEAPAKKNISAIANVDDKSDKSTTLEAPGVPPAVSNSISDMKMADPKEEITLIEPPTANHMGSAVLAYPIKIPAGRKGMEPRVVIQYNSDAGNGWLGLDWNLQTEAITIETRWGVPRYNSSLETETYVMNGEQLSPVAHRADPVMRTNEKQFYPRVEGNFDKIIRHGGDPKSYWWEVTNKNGRRWFYGGNPVNGSDQNAVLKDAAGNIAYWALAEVRDPNDNFIKYSYLKVLDTGTPNGNEGYDLYLDAISYTGHGNTQGKYSIEFIRDRQLNETKRPDILINGRWGFKQVTADLLRKILVKYNGQNIRSYELNYVQGAFYKTLLHSIAEFDASGILFTTHSFEYYNDVQPLGGNFNPLLASENWVPQNDGVKGNFINPIDQFNDNASMLSGNKSFGGGFGVAVTVGPDDEDYAMKTNTAGVNFGFNYTKSEGMLALVDINGDGLVDKVFKENGQLYFRPNRSGPGGTTEFGPRQDIIGINDFNKGETFVGNVGLESHFGIFAGFEYARTQDITSVYFADVNGDQLVDIVNNGKVYFNHIDANGNPSFTLSSGDTPSPIRSDSGIDTSLVTVDPQELEKAIDDNPLHDVVRVWVAPFTGTVSVTKPVSLIQNLSPDGLSYTANDGVRVAIQLKGTELWSTDIARDDFTPKTPTGVDAVQVQKGDRIYFRVQSKFNGAYDQVLWAPEITYSNQTPGLNDANGLPIFQFNAGKDFLLTDPVSTGLSIGGTIHIQGNFIKPITSDDVTINILKKSGGVFTTLLQQTFSWSQAANFPVSLNQNVLNGDLLFFSVSSNTNIDWTSLQWNPFVYYTASTDPGVTQLFDNNNNPLLYVYPTVDFRSFNNTIFPGLSWVAPVSDTFSIQPNPVLSPNLQTGNIVFSIKKKNQLISKQVIPVTLGILGAHPPVSLILNSNDSLFFEYHVDSANLAAAIISPSVTVDADPGGPVNVIGGLYTVDQSLKFGPLYRHWGQFAYNGNRARATQPIIESDLVLNSAINNNNPPSIDLKNTSYSGNNLTAADSINQMQSNYNNSNGYDPKKDNFIFLVPDNEKKRWIGYDDLTYVKKDTVSSSRMGKDDLLPVNPILSSGAQGSGAAGIEKVSNTDNFSLAAGYGPLGGCTSFGYTNFLYDFLDMNGDGYPDILSNNKIQYTKPVGGLEASAVTPSFGDEDVDKAEHFSIGATLGGTFLRSNASNSNSTPKGAKAAKAQTQSEIAAGLSAEFNYNQDSTAFTMMDINGDGLPDRVYRNGMVKLNIGYSFLPAESWGYDGIRQGFALSYGAGFGISISDHSIAAGIGLTRSDNETNVSLQDMNGDGLADYTFKSGSHVYVAINRGNGFAPAVEWTGADNILKAVSTGESINGAFTVGFPIIPIAPVVKLCINPSFNIAQGADRTSVQFEDIDGDGFPDFLQSEDDSHLLVLRSGIKRTNKLKKVNRPLGANFTVDYKRIGNTYDMPNSIWALSDVKIYDGVAGDGADTIHNTFDYENGRYDRNEREFYGFGKVKTFHHDTQKSDIVYRELDQDYINDNYYEKGLLRSEVLKDAAGKKFTETINTYELKDIHTGAILPGSFTQTDDGAAFPALVNSQDLFYEGQAAPGKNTSMAFTYDVLGNITNYTDFGDPGTSDDVSSVITYHSVPGKYIMDIPNTVTVIGNGQIYRQRSSTIDNNTGNITELRLYLQSGEMAKNNMAYDEYGNVITETRPQNATGQRLTYNYEYDGDVHTYNTKITDSYGYTSSSTYDVRFGKVLSATDINGQQTLFALDNAGRVSKITGPMEIAAGVPFTVAFEYHPDAVVPWALAKNFDPAHPANYIETAAFCDGLGREIQTKKDGALFVAPQSDDQEVMLVSGKIKFDAFGRIVCELQPITEPKGTTGTLNPNADSIRPTRTTFDVLDRMLTDTLPDLSINKMEYGFGTDRDGVMQFKTKVTDGNGIMVEKFVNVKELLTATKEEYRQGSDVWTSYNYDPVDELIKVTDDKGNKIVSAYDWMGRRTSVNHPDAGLTTFQYDLNNNPTQTITANLQGGPGIKYTYDQERLIKITYPQNTQNNVVLTYGASGAASFGAGHIIKQQDATGTQELSYNRLGALIKNIRVINVPDATSLTYTTELTYDTWNRLTGMIYPDGEVLTYNYNVGGLLKNMSGIKSGTTYNYLPQLGYDKFEDRVYVSYGNGTEMTYAYEPERRRLKKLTAKTAAGRMMMDNTYTYDKEENILNILNSAPIPPANLMGGSSNYHYIYDDLYRLTNATGIFNGSNHKDSFNVTLLYDNIYNILNKTQLHERKAYNSPNWVIQNQTTFNSDYSYNTGGKPHAPVHIDTRTFSFDANGNQTGWHQDVSAQNRQIVWDEENRMKSLSDNGEQFNYVYDGSGERVLKNIGEGQTVSINGKQAGKSGGLGNYTVYVNPYMVVSSGGFTKHFYIEGERIASKLGESGNGNSNGSGNGNSGGGNGNNQEAFQFYYHPDHLGNSAFITDRTGEVYQHLEYFPFGETFIDEHGNQQRTPYLYNGKELDDETGLYYYGARYYDTRTSEWESVDPPVLDELLDGQSDDRGVYKSSNLGVYNYVSQNPINFSDADGNVKITYEIYYKRKKVGGKTVTYVGRTQGTGKPAANVKKRDYGHHMTLKGFGPAKLKFSTAKYEEVRGMEQLLIDTFGGAIAGGGTSANAIRGVSLKNKKRKIYMAAGNKAFKKHPISFWKK